MMFVKERAMKAISTTRMIKNTGRNDERHGYSALTVLPFNKVKLRFFIYIDQINYESESYSYPE